MAEAEARGWFTEEDHMLAANWATCAVGEQARVAPVVTLGALTGTLIDEGAKFVGYVARGCGECLPREVSRRRIEILAAGRALDRIEDHVLALKRGEGVPA